MRSLLILCVLAFCTAQPMGYNWPPAGCPWEMINCVHGTFDAANCTQWIGNVTWDAMYTCNCDEGWSGVDCSIAETWSSCGSAIFFQNGFVAPNPFSVQCFADQSGQTFLDFEDHHIDVDVFPTANELFGMNITAYSRIHNHLHLPTPYGPVLAAIMCNVSNCQVEQSLGTVQYACDNISCSSCTLDEGCNAVLIQAMKLIAGKAAAIITLTGSGQARLVVETNILQLTLSCTMGECYQPPQTPGAPIISEDFNAQVSILVVPTMGGEGQTVIGWMAQSSSLQAQVQVMNESNVVATVLNLFASNEQVVYVAAYEVCQVMPLNETFAPMFTWTPYATSLGDQELNGVIASVWSLNGTKAYSTLFTLDASPNPTIPLRLLVGVPAENEVTIMDFADFQPTVDLTAFQVPSYCKQGVGEVHSLSALKPSLLQANSLLQRFIA